MKGWGEEERWGERGREGGREGWKVEGIKIVWIGGSM